MHHPLHLQVEAKSGKSVAIGFEAEISKPRCQRVSPHPVILTASKSLPIPAPLGPPCHLHRLPARLDLVFTPSLSVGHFLGQTVRNLRVARLLHVSVWIALDLTWHPDCPDTKSQTCARSSPLTIKSTLSPAHVTRQANTRTLVPKVSVKQPVYA